MSEVSQYPPNTFCWVELATSDGADAKRFYTGLFGWSADDNAAGKGVYTMLRLDGKDVGALYEDERLKSGGVPPHWTSYVSVTSADEKAGKAKSLKGSVVMEPFDVMEVGRMAVLQDPGGAAFAVWEPRRHTGAKVVNEPGAFCWNELATRDTDQAREFYTGLFDWDTETQQMGPTSYTSFMNRGRPAGGMLQMTEEWGGIPSHWMPYFAVEDCDSTAEEATRLGGRVSVPPTDLPNVGRFAVLRDPQGAMFSIIKLDQVSPPL